MLFQSSQGFKDFTKERYLAAAKRFPAIQKERTQAYFMLSLTFASLTFLGVFAINPTVTTIVELNKKYDDSLFVHQALTTKLGNLSNLHALYETHRDIWPKVDAAVPNEPNTAYLIGQIQSLAKETNISITNIQMFEVELTKQTTTPMAKESSYTFSLSAEGDTENLLRFLESVRQFDRVIAIESVSLTDEGTQVLTILGRTFFTP